MAIDEYKAVHPYAMVPHSFVPTPVPSPMFMPTWSLNDWVLDNGLIDIFRNLMISEDCKQETFAEDSPDFA